jgi:hypothetical protein
MAALLMHRMRLENAPATTSMSLTLPAQVRLELRKYPKHVLVSIGCSVACKETPWACGGVPAPRIWDRRAALAESCAVATCFTVSRP